MDTAIAAATRPEDLALSRAWTSGFFASPAGLPLSFEFGGKTIRGIPAAWNPVVERRRLDANMREAVFTGTDPQTGLQVRVECTEYQDYPVVEWVAWLSNQGKEEAPLIQDLLALDGQFPGDSPILHHGNGDFYSEEGYTPGQTPLGPGGQAAFAPNGGRPCDGAFPYYRIEFKGRGLSLAIGWPAQWAARFRGVVGGVQVRTGQEKTRLRLRPGERIRTPRITLLSWMGDTARAVNLWRRWYRAHLLPRPEGQPLRPLLACCCPDEGEEFTAATEENQLRYIERFKRQQIPFDVWWIDAGWYPCYNQDRERKWWITGTWEPDPERFPRGLKPVSDRVAREGAGLLVWFEPERIQPGTKLDVERGEWLLRAKGSDNGLLNLGDPKCRAWLTDHVCRLIADNGIKIYRQDHNFPPLEHWRQNEAEDRQGMNENLHVQGYLQYWDELLARNPGLWIDSCSSGGRRNDLETMRRSVPLHYTDYGYGDHPVKLAFHRTLYEWIPYFKEATLSWDLGARDKFDNQVDSFSYHCALAPMLFATLDIRRDDYDFALVRKMVGVWRRAAELILHGDYYPHTPFHHRADQWVAWQFDCPEQGRGFVQGIRLPAAPEEQLTIRLQGLRADRGYRFEQGETGETRTISGAELQEKGFTFALPRRSGEAWFYTEVR
jgi:alpha-galactosidase